ncbi:YdiU family protein [Uliginosibacterium sp. 31-16]|uniref:protein adenylyltransferase SelO n=1 Tax=Uliginosibacterium sp. 31-16 TaxID=3068315 RepID=UPI00273E7CB9|nr:YdiU family protein [Uliginosibacterium sp. 31-16]MDP5238711.1 YdiU family protein [Uliginosibacterium sp. 31-16]
MSLPADLAALRFDARFIRSLPADALDTPQPRQVQGAVYSFCAPTPVAAPRLLHWSADCAALLGLGTAPLDAQAAAEVFAGNRLLPGSQPYATCYGGHQFGNWAGQLGDGRATMLGTAIGADDIRLEVQLKGAGLTPYSRHADGRAVLRSSIREYLCSEAMHRLGVPTTRALCLVATGEPVLRDMFYDGHPQHEPGAIVTRVAPSFLRFGHFEIFAARGELALLRQLLDDTIRTHFPALGAPSPEVYVAWFGEVCRRTALMVAHWLRVGFVHGVMNTDNLSVLGLSIDYGPYGWLDNFDPGFTPNTTDRGGRYAYAQQARIAGWNLSCLANALMPLVQDQAALEACLEAYADHFEACYLAMLRDKLGLLQEGDAEADFKLVSELFACFAAVDTDMTIFYRALARIHPDTAPEAALAELAPAFYAPPGAGVLAQFAGWLMVWQARIAASPEPAAAHAARMNAANPWIIPRNWLAQDAIKAAEAGDLSVLERLMQAIRDPYTEQAGCADLAGRRPDWARNAPGCSALSCSS